MTVEKPHSPRRRSLSPSRKHQDRVWKDIQTKARGLTYMKLPLALIIILGAVVLIQQVRPSLGGNGESNISGIVWHLPLHDMDMVKKRDARGTRSVKDINVAKEPWFPGSFPATGPSVVTLRHPFARLSEYFDFGDVSKNPGDHASVRHWVEDGPGNGRYQILDNYMVRCLAGKEAYKLPIGKLGPEHLRQAMATLARFDVVLRDDCAAHDVALLLPYLSDMQGVSEELLSDIPQPKSATSPLPTPHLQSLNKLDLDLWKFAVTLIKSRSPATPVNTLTTKNNVMSKTDSSLGCGLGAPPYFTGESAVIFTSAPNTCVVVAGLACGLRNIGFGVTIVYKPRKDAYGDVGKEEGCADAWSGCAQEVLEGAQFATNQKASPKTFSVSVVTTPTVDAEELLTWRTDPLLAQVPEAMFGASVKRVLWIVHHTMDVLESSTITGGRMLYLEQEIGDRLSLVSLAEHVSDHLNKELDSADPVPYMYPIHPPSHFSARTLSSSAGHGAIAGAARPKKVVFVLQAETGGSWGTYDEVFTTLGELCARREKTMNNFTLLLIGKGAADAANSETFEPCLKERIQVQACTTLACQYSATRSGHFVIAPTTTAEYTKERAGSAVTRAVTLELPILASQPTLELYPCLRDQKLHLVHAASGVSERLQAALTASFDKIALMKVEVLECKAQWSDHTSEALMDALAASKETTAQHHPSTVNFQSGDQSVEDVSSDENALNMKDGESIEEMHADHVEDTAKDDISEDTVKDVVQPGLEEEEEVIEEAASPGGNMVSVVVQKMPGMSRPEPPVWPKKVLPRGSKSQPKQITEEYASKVSPGASTWGVGERGNRKAAFLTTADHKKPAPGWTGRGASPENHVYALPYPNDYYKTERMFHVFVPVYNGEDFITECVDSILQQRYKKFRVYVYDDGSTDGTAELVSMRYMTDSRVVLLSNTKNMGPGYSKWMGFTAIRQYAEPNDVVMVVDGDDYLATAEALSIINLQYIGAKCWMTYGSYVGPFSSEVGPIPSTNDIDFRKSGWRYGHPRTFKAFLIDHLSEADFKQGNGKWLTKGTDRGFILRFLELSGVDRTIYIKTPVYVYRKHSHNTFKKISNEDKMKQLHHVNALPQSNAIEEAIHVFVVVWGRVHLLNNIITELTIKQTVGKRVHLHLWNNNPLINQQVDDIVNSFVTKHSLKIDLHHSKVNLFSYARFVHITQARSKFPMDYAIIVDDDQSFAPTYIEKLYRDRLPRTYRSWWGRQFAGRAYFDGFPDYGDLIHGRRPEIQRFDYAGPGGCVVDVDAFLMDATLMIPKDFIALDDLWLSYVMYMAKWVVARTMTKPTPITDAKTTSVALWVGLKKEKDEFLQYLRRGGWKV